MRHTAEQPLRSNNMTRFGATLCGAAVLAMLVSGCNTSTPENTHFGRGYIYHLDKRHEKAESEYREVLTVRPDTPEVFFNLGQLAEARQDWQKAKAYYEDARRTYPQTANEKIAETHMALGAIYFREGQHQQALDQFQQAAVQHGTDHRIHYNTGVALEALAAKALEEGHPAEEIDGLNNDAIAAYDRAIDLKPDFGPAHLGLAFIYEDKGDIETANLHHSIARQNGEDDTVLVNKLIWWNTWQEREITVRDNALQPKFTVQHPSDWRVGSAAQAGTTIVRTYADTAAIIIGEKCSVQIVGPDDRNTFARKEGDVGPREWAATKLNGWLADNIPELFLAGEENGDGSGDDGTGDDGSGNGDGDQAAPSARWSFDGEVTAFSYRNGTTGAMQRVTHTDANGRVSHIAFHFYLGQENSYVVVTTREADASKRIGHGLRYVVNYFGELVSNTR